MKYIVQFFREVAPGPVSWSGSLLEFQVIFSAKSDKEAGVKSKVVFDKWVKDSGQIGMYYTPQLLRLNHFIEMKESQYKIYRDLK